MACATCEKVNEWTRRLLKQSEERMRLCLERLSNKANRAEQSTTEESEHADRAKQSTDSDQQRAERTDQ